MIDPDSNPDQSGLESGLNAFTQTATNPVYFMNILSELAFLWLRGFTTRHEY